MIEYSLEEDSDLIEKHRPNESMFSIAKENKTTVSLISIS